ncbi:MAG TPA: response regulator [Gammaproteobacteria bacterium]|nr:response regulator [Gammaproteobacteria bacterium]
MSASVQKSKPYLTPTEVASMLMVSPITVRQWAAKGLLKAELTLGGHRRFMRHEIERFAREHGLTLQREDGDERTRLLIVDDDPQLVRLVTAALEDRPELTIETATDGFEAGLKVQQFHPDVLLIDLMMPGLDGFEVCRRLKADPQTRGIRVIAMTGYASPENAARALDAGAEHCLAKPFDLRMLEELFTRPVRAVR